MACIWCSGCVHKEKPDLETLPLEENRSVAESESAVQAPSQAGGDTAVTENTGDNKNNENSNTQQPGTSGNQSAGTESTQSVFVYVCGAVRTPGVYELPSGARLYEAIACAGGVREDAAEESINQAQAVSDGERLYIPTDEEVRQGLDTYLRSGIAVGGTGSLEGAGAADTISPGGESGSNAEGKVNINTASLEELKTLNGIGDTRAGSIVAYRESNGLFGSIEDLMNVDGIKEGVYNKLKDNITVN